MSSFSINAFVIIQVFQSCSNIKIHAALNKRILKLSLTFRDLSIDLSLANASHASSIRIFKSRSFDLMCDPIYLKSSTMLIGWPFMARWSVGNKLDDWFSRICTVFWTLISRPTFLASCYNALGMSRVVFK